MDLGLRNPGHFTKPSLEISYAVKTEQNSKEKGPPRGAANARVAARATSCEGSALQQGASAKASARATERCNQSTDPQFEGSDSGWVRRLWFGRKRHRWASRLHETAS